MERNHVIILVLILIGSVILFTYNQQENETNVSPGTANYNTEAIANIASVYAESTNGTNSFNNIRVTGDVTSKNSLIGIRLCDLNGICIAPDNIQSVSGLGSLQRTIGNSQWNISPLGNLGTNGDISARNIVGNYKLGGERMWTDLVGGSGGSVYERSCPDGKVMVGISGKAGQAVDSIQAICK